MGLLTLPLQEAGPHRSYSGVVLQLALAPLASSVPFPALEVSLLALELQEVVQQEEVRALRPLLVLELEASLVDVQALEVVVAVQLQVASPPLETEHRMETSLEQEEPSLKHMDPWPEGGRQVLLSEGNLVPYPEELEVETVMSQQLFELEAHILLDVSYQELRDAMVPPLPLWVEEPFQDAMVQQQHPWRMDVDIPLQQQRLVVVHEVVHRHRRVVADTSVQADTRPMVPVERQQRLAQQLVQQRLGHRQQKTEVQLVVGFQLCAWHQVMNYRSGGADCWSLMVLQSQFPALGPQDIRISFQRQDGRNSQGFPRTGSLSG